jgi:flagellar basal-body rod protein FlgC
MGLFDAIDASGSGLSAERMRMDVVSENLANAQTTKGADGKAYQRKEVVLQQATPSGSAFSAVLGGMLGGAQSRVSGVQVAAITTDKTSGRKVYDPSHPDADKSGYVTMPNVNSVTEMTDLISSSRAYEADVTAMQTAKTMFSKTLDILR